MNITDAQFRDEVRQTWREAVLSCAKSARDVAKLTPGYVTGREALELYAQTIENTEAMND